MIASFPKFDLIRQILSGTESELVTLSDVFAYNKASASELVGFGDLATTKSAESATFGPDVRTEPDKSV